MSTTPTVAVVGGGASGTLTAAHLACAAALHRRRVEILIIEPDELGQGIAYSATDARHRLNVPAGKMTAWPADPEHFLRWLRANGDPDAAAASFASRRDYGRYLAAVLVDAVATSPGVTCEHLRTRATALTRHGRRLRLRLATSAVRPVDLAVLALGNGVPQTAWAPAELLRSSRFVSDPWAPGALESVPSGQDVLLVGAGLTMADMVVSLAPSVGVLHAVSRHGMLPLAHATHPLAAVDTPALPPAPATAADARRAVVDHIRSIVDAGGDWRSAVDSFRPVTAALWERIDETGRSALLQGGRRRWDRLRHRVAPQVGAVLSGCADAGRLVSHAATVADVRETGSTVVVTLTDGSRLEVGAVLNCTGAQGDLRTEGDPLVLGLLSSGAARPGPMNLGFDTDDRGRILAADGMASSALWTLGPLRRGTLFESTAIPEIREQAAALAVSLVENLPDRRIQRRPRDVYGLPLSATPEAAALYNSALGRILRVQSGAETLLAEAVAADPRFALGHATLALIGSEWGAAIDVDSALAAARATQSRGDERERRFVQVAAERISRPGARSAASLLSHIQDYPEDALAVSIAVPTIAFAGATEVPQEAWSLVEGLAPSYGADWWYAGLLAFMRQEQGRYGEAMELSTRALEIEPASGHAVHARTHVHYETGDHAAGLAWLDPWIAQCGRQASHRAHFSWHAALHELALGRDSAAADRYAAQLAPPAVTGVRALVDSASLLWRGHAAGAWNWPSVDEVLASVPEALLRRPPTAFVALHVAVALAAAGDTAALVHLAADSAGRVEPVFVTTIAPLATALACLTRGDYGQATDGLLAVDGVSRVGGSAAQQEIVEETLLFTALSARRFDVARAVLQRRLDRRPSPRDLRRLAALTPAWSPNMSVPASHGGRMPGRVDHLARGATVQGGNAGIAVTGPNR